MIVERCLGINPDLHISLTKTTMNNAEIKFTQQDNIEEVVVVKSIYQTLSKERKERLLKLVKQWCEDELNKIH